MSLVDMSLKWRLLIPLIALSFFGTTGLIAFSHFSHRRLAQEHEKALLLGILKSFESMMEAKKNQALALATALSLDPHVREALRAKDRKALLGHLRPIYKELKRKWNVTQIHLHLPPGVSFLRVHIPRVYGDSLRETRPDVLHVLREGVPTGGPWWGISGFSMRGVVPVKEGGAILGSLEVGVSVGAEFFQRLKEEHRCEITIYGLLDGPRVMATSLANPPPMDEREAKAILKGPSPLLRVPLPEDKEVSEILAPVQGPLDEASAIVSIRVSREPVTVYLMDNLRKMLLMELIGLVASALVIWVVVRGFLGPIRQMVELAQRVASGERIQIGFRGRSELGRLARALNSMVGYLEASRERTKDYARNLEKEVERRTRELRASEERYRKLLERLPLVVYQMTPERKLIFVSSFCNTMLGVQAEELLQRPDGWDSFVASEEREKLLASFREAMEMEKGWEAEYRVILPDGRSLFVREQANRIVEEEGRKVLVEGILLDMTLQRRLQEMSLQAEELKTLAEISSRLAHELRNPLTSIGGLCRRLIKTLDPANPCLSLANAMLRDVERLEAMLEMILAYIQPVDVEPEPRDLASLAKDILEDLRPEFQHRGSDIFWEIQDGLPPVDLDPKSFGKALEILIRHTLFRMERGTPLRFRIREEDTRVTIRLTYKAPHLAADDLEHYFYPFLAQESPDQALLELPVARNILFRHGALVRVESGPEPGEVILEVTLPRGKEK